VAVCAAPEANNARKVPTNKSEWDSTANESPTNSQSAHLSPRRVPKNHLHSERSESFPQPPDSIHSIPFAPEHIKPPKNPQALASSAVKNEEAPRRPSDIPPCHDESVPRQCEAILQTSVEKASENTENTLRRRVHSIVYTMSRSKSSVVKAGKKVPRRVVLKLSNSDSRIHSQPIVLRVLLFLYRHASLEVLACCTKLSFVSGHRSAPPSSVHVTSI
jgi:hypothetical protein